MSIEKFEIACKIVSQNNRKQNVKMDVNVNNNYIIGTLMEKSVHAVLKNYIEPNNIFHEIKIENYIADIAYDDEIFEIQTKAFNLLRGKLNCYLTNYTVNIVYPVIKEKTIIWINPKDGSVSEIRKSPKKESFYNIFKELYKIKSFLNNENLNIILLKLEADEFRYLDGFSKNKKNKATKGDIIPTELIDVFYITNKNDFKKLIPKTLSIPFTTKDFAKHAKISLKLSQVALNILHYVNVVNRVGKKSNSYLYEIL